jgi:arginyl-tRNA synthetase
VAADVVARADLAGCAAEVSGPGFVNLTVSDAALGALLTALAAVARAAAVARRNNPDLCGDALASVARAVGIGAVKYADLAADRTNDYVFDWDRLLSLAGAVPARHRGAGPDVS